MADPHPGSTAPTPLRVVVYSDDRTTREQVRLALGSRVAVDLPPVALVEVATQVALVNAVDAGGVDLVVLDGEATPAGGLGMARQLKDEVAKCPPLLVLVARQQDAWLATWSGADAALAYPLDPVRLPEVAAGLLRASLAGTGS
ncbi:ANTAR domain-containing protein [Auraticoccus monumenti]|uniref:Response regulatory domain-containing protein n=1 Tax=Auraticoccus monumenti TaxID=675864 RepID=A0A1G7DUC5_9ACTN|nr:hypothetical protein [Auraticoccus monumenti]SDE55048.1 hypothetical protein SAMN04489747_3714 [Auraticoccus monumenti]